MSDVGWFGWAGRLGERYWCCSSKPGSQVGEGVQQQHQSGSWRETISVLRFAYRGEQRI